MCLIYGLPRVSVYLSCILFRRLTKVNKGECAGKHHQSHMGASTVRIFRLTAWTERVWCTLSEHTIQRWFLLRETQGSQCDHYSGKGLKLCETTVKRGRLFEDNICIARRKWKKLCFQGHWNPSIFHWIRLKLNRIF